MYVLALVIIEQIFTFIRKTYKTFCRNDTFDIKTFISEQLEKISKYYRDLDNCSFKFEIFPLCEKIAFVRPMLKKRQSSRYFKFISALIQHFVFVQNNGVCLLTAVAETFEQLSLFISLPICV